MTEEQHDDLQEALEQLRAEHRVLDDQVVAMQQAGNSDPLKLARLKKRKLALKDRISLLEDQLNPDIIA